MRLSVSFLIYYVVLAVFITFMNDKANEDIIWIFFVGFVGYFFYKVLRKIESIVHVLHDMDDGIEEIREGLNIEEISLTDDETTELTFIDLSRGSLIIRATFTGLKVCVIRDVHHEESHIILITTGNEIIKIHMAYRKSQSCVTGSYHYFTSLNAASKWYRENTDNSAVTSFK